MAVTTPTDQTLKGWSAFEHRVAQSAEYLLILTFMMIFWMAGFVDLFTHTSEPKQVLGLYSLPFFILLLVYGSGFIAWGIFLFHPRGLDWFKQSIAYMQNRVWVGGGLLLLFAALIASMYIYGERWIRFPLLEIAVILMIILVTSVILFVNPITTQKMQRWRKVVIAMLAVIAGIEILLQAGALLRISPVENLNGLFTPYGRVYTPSEGGSSGNTNANGWYYPDFRLKEGSKRYALVGGSYLLGLQVAPIQNMGVILDKLMSSDKENPREVVSMGTPDYGLQVFLHERMFPFTAGTVNPEEVIVVFHVLNDFQAIDGPNGIIPYAVLNADGVVDVPESDIVLRHDLWHTVIRGYDPPNPAQTVQSHLFIASVLGDALSKATGQHPYLADGYSNTDHVTDEQPFAGLEYLFARDQADPRIETTLQLTTLQLESWQAKVEESGTKMRLVILPYFPPSFYETAPTNSWTGEVDGFDLFAPERALQEWAIARGISVLPLGQYMQAAGLSSSDVQALFLRDGIGHLNAQGHQSVAEAIHTCFYAGAQETRFAELGCTGE